MKKLITLVLAICMVLALAACGAPAPAAPADKAETPAEPEAEGYTVNACIASEPETIDPNLVASVDGSTYTQHQFENLMKYKMIDAHPAALPAENPNVCDTEVVYGQAESYEVSEDMCTYTFKLRDDIFWSDGEPVKAGDWVYSWRRLVDPATGADYGYFLDGVVLNAAAIQNEEKKVEELGVKALDDKTFEVTLEAPCPYFIEMCAFSALVPLREDVVEGNDTWTEPENIVVNGAYKVSEWAHDSYIKMVPNEMYYDVDNLGPAEIVWHLSDSETAILSAYQNGEYDFIDSFPTDMIDTLKASGDCFINPYVGTYYLYLNCDKITDWRVRAALTLSMDRENIVTNVTQGGQVPAKGFVASGILDSTGADFSEGASELGAIFNTLAKMYPDADLESYAGRCALAKELYDEAVEEGAWDANTTLVYNFNTSEAHKAIAEACGSDWGTVLGIKITLENQEWGTYTTGLGEHKFGVARLGWIADYNDPITYLELMTTGNSYNYGLYSDPEFDKFIADAKKMPADADRDALLYKAEEALFGEGGFPVSPVYYYTNAYCMKGLSNVGYTSMGYFFLQYAVK